MRSPGQDLMFLKPGDIFEIQCPNQTVGRPRCVRAVCSLLAFAVSLGTAILLSVPLPLFAQTEVGVTFDRAITEALARNPALAVERNEIDIVAGTLRQARVFPFNPELELEGSVGRGRSRDGEERRGIDSKGIGLSQTIPLRGQWGLQIRSAEAGLDRAKWLVSDAERQIIGDVLRTFGELLVGQQRVALARELVALATEVRETARKLFEADAVPQIDVFRAEVELNKASNRLVTEQRNLRTVQQEMALLLGRPADQTFRGEGPLTLPLPTPDLTGLHQMALERRPDLAAARAALRAAEAELARVRAERFFPEVKIGAKYEEARDFDALNRTGLLTLSIPLPLLNQRQGDLQRAMAELKKQEASVELVQRQIQKEVATSYQQVQASQGVTEAYAGRILPDQDRNFRLLREGYNLGQFTLTDVLVGQREFIEAREPYLDAVASLNASIAELYRALDLRP